MNARETAVSQHFEKVEPVMRTAMQVCVHFAS